MEWGKIRDGGEQLFLRPGGKSGIKESVGVCYKGGKKRNERVKVSSFVLELFVGNPQC